MTAISSQTWLFALLLLALVLSVTAILALLAMRRSLRSLTARVAEVQQGQRSLQGQFVHMGQRILSGEQHLRELRTQAAPPVAPTLSASARAAVPEPDFHAELQAAQADAGGQQNTPAGAGSGTSEPDDMTQLAQQLLLDGEDPATVAERCGLSQSEMDLLVAITQSSQSRAL